MFEHVGLSQLETYFDRLMELLMPEGRLLNHAISRPAALHGKTRSRFKKFSFIDRYVFPDGELHEVGSVVSALQRRGFEARHVESLREHYALTLRAWTATSKPTGTARSARRRGPGPGVAPLHGRVRDHLRGRQQPDPPGPRGQAQRRRERHAAAPVVHVEPFAPSLVHVDGGGAHGVGPSSTYASPGRGRAAEPTPAPRGRR